jgi:hypothetical protein
VVVQGTYSASLSAAKGWRTGHAGAVISAVVEAAQEKVEILKETCVVIVPTPSSFGEVAADTLARMKKAAGLPRLSTLGVPLTYARAPLPSSRA